MSAGRVISAFPATGKSWLAEHHSNVVDSDSSEYSWDYPTRPGVERDQHHPDWPGNYVAHIRHALSGDEVVLVSTHAEVRAALVDAGIPFTLVYPVGHLLDEYLERMATRFSPVALMQAVAEHWDAWLSELAEQECAQRVVLGSGKYLSDVVDQVLA